MDENKNPQSSGGTSENNEFNFVIEDPYAGKVSSGEDRHHHHHHHHHHSRSHHSGRKKKKHSTHKKVSKFKEPSIRVLTVWVAVLTLICVVLTIWNFELASSVRVSSDKIKALSANSGAYVENGSESDSSDEHIPGFVKNEAQKVVDSVAALQNEETISFIAVSDAHLKLDDERSLESIKHAGQAMKLIRDGLEIDFAVALGDMTWGANNTPIDTGIKEIEKVNEFIADGFDGIPNMRLIGNHDTLEQSSVKNGKVLDAADLYDVIGKYNEGAVFPAEQKGYFYRDIDDAKLRLICLNTSEIDIDESGIDLDIKPEQVKWLADSLDLSAKADAADWKILILSHHPLNWYETYAEMVDVLDAYSFGTAGSVNLEGVDVSFDFTGKNAAKIIANVHGHLHNYRTSTIGISKIPTVCIPNAAYNRNNEIGTLYSYSEDIKNKYGEKETYEKTENSADDTAFSVVTIDLKYNRIYVTNYGAGYDRDVSF